MLPLPSMKAWEDSKGSRPKPHCRRCHAPGILIKDVRTVFMDLLCFFKNTFFFLFKANWDELFPWHVLLEPLPQQPVCVIYLCTSKVQEYRGSQLQDALTDFCAEGLCDYFMCGFCCFDFFVVFGFLLALCDSILVSIIKLHLYY